MAYVPGFSNDVFISYAHVDNAPLGDEEEGWITKLHRSLLKALPIKIGRGEGLRLYRDSKLRGNDIFDEALSAEYRDSAVFISVLTPSYLASEWCMKELKGFSEQSRPPFARRVGKKSRALRVMPSPHVPREQHPEPLEGSNGYRFYALDAVTGDEEPFRRTKPEDPDQRYWNVLHDLARDVAALLKEMKRVAEGAAPGKGDEAVPPDARPPSPVGVAQPIGPGVYLAEVTDDLLDQRDQVKRHLEQQGLRVLPEAPLPQSAAEFAEAVRRALSACDVSVHLVGPYYGRTPPGDERSFAQAQYAEAVAASQARAGEKKKDLARLVWLKDGLEIERVADERQRRFLESLEDDPAAEAHAEVLKVGLEELKEIVLTRARPPEPEQDENPFFYISCTPDDDAQARKILSCLRTENLEGVVSPPHNGVDKKAFQKYHRSNLRRCDVFMILYGSAPELWVHERVLEARDAARLRKKKRMALSVCAWPPPPKDEMRFSVNNLHLWRVDEELRCDDVKRFIREIRRA